MAIRTYKLILDSKNTIAPEPVLLRQGDKTGAVVIEATLMDNGEPVSLDGLTPSFMANTADGKAVIVDSTGFNIVNASGGEFTYQVSSKIGSVPGKIKIAYFSFTDESGNQSTFDVAFIISKAADMTQESAKDWVSSLSKIIEQYNQWANDAHNSWEQFVNDNKTIIESIDPGGKVLSEITDFRHSDMLSKTFDTAKLRGDFFDQEFSGRGVNVKWFGAVGDGTTDDTDAITKAIKAASGESHSVYFPAGKYAVKFGQMLLPVGLKIFGESKKNTVLLQSGNSAIWQLNAHNWIDNLSFENMTATEPTSLLYCGGPKGNPEVYFTKVTNCDFYGGSLPGVTAAIFNTSGHSNTLYGIYFDLQYPNGYYKIAVDGCDFYLLQDGIRFKFSNGAWLTGSTFTNCFAASCAEAGIFCSSLDLTANEQFSHNTFDNITVETLNTPTAEYIKNAMGFRVIGNMNTWSNLRMFHDGDDSGIAIQLGNMTSTTQYPAFLEGVWANRFVNSTLEGKIDDPYDQYDFNKWENFVCVIPNNDDTGHTFKVSGTSKRENLIPSAELKQFDINGHHGHINVIHYANVTSGTDENGSYIELTSPSSAECQVLIDITNPRAVAHAISSGMFTIGVRYKDLRVSGADTFVKTGITFGSNMSAGGQIVPTNKDLIANQKNYKAASPLANNVFDSMLAYELTQSVRSGIGAAVYGSTWLTIPVNSSIRLYDFYMVAGVVHDSSEVASSMSVSNTVSATNLITDNSNKVTNSGNTTFSVANNLNDYQGAWLRLSAHFGATNIKKVDSIGGNPVALYEFSITYEDGSTDAISFGIANLTNNYVNSIMDRFIHIKYMKIKSVRVAAEILADASLGSAIIDDCQINVCAYG